MEWYENDTDEVTGRIEKINMQFSKLLEEMNVSSEVEATPSNFKVSLGEIKEPEVLENTVPAKNENYHANLIEKSRQIRGLPKHAMIVEMSPIDKSILDEELKKAYVTRKKKEKASVVYNMEEILETNKSNTVVIDYNEIPAERALVTKKTWKDILFAEIDLNKQIDVWGAVKRFCSIQVNIKF